MAVGPNILAVKKDSPAKTVPELIAHAKANGKLSYASQGNGSTSHLTMELFKSRTGIQITHVPYKGAAPAVNDLAGGHVDTMFCDLGTILQLHRANRVRIIAAATPKRIALLPDIPTIDESALPGFISTTFFSLMAPPGDTARRPREAQQGHRRRDAHARGAGEAEIDLCRTSDLDIDAMDDSSSPRRSSGAASSAPPRSPSSSESVELHRRHRPRRRAIHEARTPGLLDAPPSRGMTTWMATAPRP